MNEPTHGGRPVDPRPSQHPRAQLANPLADWHLPRDSMPFNPSAEEACYLRARALDAAAYVAPDVDAAFEDDRDAQIETVVAVAKRFQRYLLTGE